MNKTKGNVFLVLLLSSLALVGFLNVYKILKAQVPFYKSATVHAIEIDSISLISSDPAYGVHSIIGYGYLGVENNYLAVDMTDGVNINAFSSALEYKFFGIMGSKF